MCFFRYNETLDEMMGCNLLISAEENFNKVKVVTVRTFLRYTFADRNYFFCLFHFSLVITSHHLAFQVLNLYLELMIQLLLPFKRKSSTVKQPLTLPRLP